jgi:anti-sigma regulatory factor (Ser/Thr protein kinase)
LLRHELRTPLTGMLSLAELLSSHPLPARSANWVATLQACGQQMARLIDRSLRTEPQATEPQMISDIDGLGLLETLIVAHWPAAQQSGISLLLIFQPEARVIWQTDAVALRQALDNLLSNAIRFTRSGQVTLEARVVPKDGTDHDQLELLVEDSGSGSDSSPSNLRDGTDYADRTYRMFSRGLGLKVVEQACQRHSGRLLQSASTMGGASFALQLPGVIAPHRRYSQPFGPMLQQKLSCLICLESPRQRAVAAMLACLDISFECIDSPDALRVPSGPAKPVLICTRDKLPEHLFPDLLSHSPMQVGDDANANPICLLDFGYVERPEECELQVLPEPLLLTELQTALLRCLVMQGSAVSRNQALPE